LVREVVGTTSTGYVTGLRIDEPLVRGGNEFYLLDALGSVLKLTDAAGAIASSYRYDPFGSVIVDSGSSSNQLQFTGREQDGTHLQYSRARYYSPQLHRFISQDPLGFAGGDTNLYAYVRNAPQRLRDPLGLWPEFDEGYEPPDETIAPPLDSPDSSPPSPRS